VGGNIADYIYDSFPDKRNILDYGCGPGFLIEHLLKKDFFVTGLEFSKNSLQLVSQKFSKINNFSGAFEYNGIIEKDLKFDIITLVEVIEHLNDLYLRKTLNNIKSVLNRNGVLVITTPNDEDLKNSTVFCPNCDHVFHRWQHLRSWSIESLSEYLLENGFIINDVFTTNFSMPLTRKQNTIPSTYKTSLFKRLSDFIFSKLLVNNIANNPNSDSKDEPQTIIHKQPHLVAVVQLARK